MARVLALLSMSAISIALGTVPVGTIVAMTLAATVGLLAVRFHGAAEALELGGSPDAKPVLRTARWFDDAALALCVLALLFALPL